MDNILRQSTAVTVRYGPLVNPTDGVTLMTAAAGTGANQLENASTGLMLSKNGGTYALRNGTPTASVYDSSDYKVTLNTTDVGTLGALRVSAAHITAYAPYWRDFKVVPANVYDSLVGGSDLLQVDIASVNNVSGDAALLDALCKGNLLAVVDTSITPSTPNSFACSNLTTLIGLNGKQGTIISGALVNQWLGAVTAVALVSGQLVITWGQASPTGGALSTGDIVSIGS